MVLVLGLKVRWFLSQLVSTSLVPPFPAGSHHLLPDFFDLTVTHRKVVLYSDQTDSAI